MLYYSDVKYDDVNAAVRLIAETCHKAEIPVNTLYGACLMIVYIIASQKATVDINTAVAFTKEMSEWVGLRLQDPQGQPS